MMILRESDEKRNKKVWGLLPCYIPLCQGLLTSVALENLLLADAWPVETCSSKHDEKSGLPNLSLFGRVVAF